MISSSIQPTLFDQIQVDEYEAVEEEQKLKQETESQQQKATTNLQRSARQLRAMELLAVVTGMSHVQAEEVLKKTGGALELARLPEQALAGLPHIGEVRAKKISAMTGWAKLISEAETDQRTQIRSPADVANLLMLDMSLLEREQLRVVGLDTKNNVCFVDTVYSGSLNTAVVRVAEVLRMAILMNCASIIMAHNHPSGDVSPSPEDIRVTEAIREAGERLDIKVLDHLIIGGNRYLSLKEKGLGFS